MGASDLTVDQRRALLERIESESASTQERIVSLERVFDDIVASAELSNIDDEHDPEGATIAYERALVASHLETARAALAGLEDVLVRVQSGEAGSCAVCARPIPIERLLALPSTTVCVGCARDHGRPD